MCKKGYHSSGSGDKRDFVTVEYETGDESSNRPSVEPPELLPCGASLGGCQVWRHAWRSRLHGPSHDLLVVHCVTHGTYFTLYPPGFIPYGRARLAPEGPARTLEDWRETAFTAVLDAARETAWTREMTGCRSWWTQVRWIDRGARWLGLTDDPRTAEQAARTLGVDLATHDGARRTFQAGGYRQKGRAVGCVLEAIAADEALMRVLHCGQTLGSWGRIWGRDAGGRLRPLFRGGE